MYSSTKGFLKKLIKNIHQRKNPFYLHWKFRQKIIANFLTIRFNKDDNVNNSKFIVAVSEKLKAA